MRFINMIRWTSVVCSVPKTMIIRHSSNLSSFKESLQAAKNVVIISGHDISSESGLPTYDTKGHWRKYQASSLATSGAFLTFPSLVWEFYHHRREIATQAQPNEAHKAIAQFEEKYGSEKSITVITQSIDGLHSRAGTKKLIELHGSLFKTRCIRCNDVLTNHDSPICEVLANKGSPNVQDTHSDIPEDLLPHCQKPNCSGLLRPHIVWFGETLESSVAEKAEKAMSTCEVCLLVGSAASMFPGAIYASDAIKNGAIVAEFNTSPTENVELHYFFDGPCSKTVSEALDLERIA
ncbi:hypothetical protein PYW07_001796 [Mythimna separata]|uniref:Deacetylase sirtuin-type domain-containing protein n=1 Tax=Mythimna separata TaxID=271217 RepID=A0AAD7YSX7_MYTSE|nr:hypothetical protein PYW07_001796 [Mythimna separata]